MQNGTRQPDVPIDAVALDWKRRYNAFPQDLCTANQIVVTIDAREPIMVEEAEDYFDLFGTASAKLMTLIVEVTCMLTPSRPAAFGEAAKWT